MKLRRGWLPLGVVVLVGTGTLLSPGFHKQAHAQSATSKTQQKMPLAVVDYQSLVKNHPDYEKLRQLDEQLETLRQDKEWLPHEADSKAREEAYKKMQEAVDKGRAELEAEKARLDAEMSGLAGSMKAQMEAEMNRLHSAAEEKLKGDVARLRPKAPPQQAEAPPAPGRPGQPDSPHVSLNEYQKDVMLIRQRNLTAHRLEMEKASRNEIEAERAKLDQEQSAYEDKIGATYQDEKLNLQLKLQVSQDETEQQKLQTRLNEMADEVSVKKAAKRKELDERFQAIRTTKQAAFEEDYRKYQRKLDQEVIQKGIAAPRAPAVATAPQPRPEAPKQVAGRPGPPPKEITDEVARLQAGVKSEMEAAEAKCRATMQAKADEARAQLIAKQKKIQGELAKTEEQLKALFEEQKKHLSKRTEEKIAAIEKQIKKVSDERKSLYDKMVADLNKVVEGVAVKKDVPMVIREGIYNRNCTDLTDFSMVALKQMESK